jgi:hypothetical protein
MSKVVYTISGREAKQVKRLQQGLADGQRLLAGLLGFIAEREQLDLQHVTFQQDTLEFREREDPAGAGP